MKLAMSLSKAAYLLLPMTTSATTCQENIAKYDNIANGPLLPVLREIGTYQGLEYTGFAPYKSANLGWLVAFVLNILKLSLPVDLETLLSGPEPQSGDAVASIGLLSSPLGTGQTTGNPTGTISIGPDVASFDVDTFYFGCILNGAGATGVGVTPCTIQISGTHENGTDVASQTFTYAPGPDLARQQFQTRFADLKELRVTVVDGTVAAASTVALFDDFVHCNKLI